MSSLVRVENYKPHLHSGGCGLPFVCSRGKGRSCYSLCKRDHDKTLNENMEWGICRCGINPIAWTEDDRFLLLRLVEVNIPTTKNVGRKDKTSEAWENVAKAMFSRTGKEWAAQKLKDNYKKELKLHRQMKARRRRRKQARIKVGVIISFATILHFVRSWYLNELAIIIVTGYIIVVMI